MRTWTRVLCPTDFSEASLEALDVACSLARRLDASLCLLHVAMSLPPSSNEVRGADYAPVAYEHAVVDDYSAQLHQLMQQRVPRELRGHAVVRFGDAAEEIASAAADEDADFIVMSTHGRTGWRHLVYGSVTEKALRLADCPVLVVRASENPTTETAAAQAALHDGAGVPDDVDNVLV